MMDLITILIAGFVIWLLMQFSFTKAIRVAMIALILVGTFTSICHNHSGFELNMDELVSSAANSFIETNFTEF